MAAQNPMIELLQTEETLGEMIENRTRNLPDKPALIFYDDEVTYRELNEKVDGLATALLDMGITAEDRIAIIMPTRPEFIYLWLAASKIGASVVGLNFRYQQDEVVYMVNNSRPSVLVCINEFAFTNYNTFLSDIRERIPSVKQFVFLGKTEFPGAIDFNELLATKPDDAKLSEAKKEMKGESDNFIIYTAGTTGKPKGAVLTQKSIMAMMKLWTKNLELSPDDRILCILPLNHVGGGTIMALSSLASGITLVLHDMFMPDQLVDIIREHKVTVFGAVPTVFEILFAARRDIAAGMLPSIRLTAYGGSPATPEVLKAMREKFDAPVMACYGSTEVSGFITYTKSDDPFEKTMTAGRVPEGVEAKIVAPDTREELPKGEIGEIAFRSDMIFDRYLDMPEETKNAFDDEGWFYMGDLGYFDEDGFLVIAGRTKEMYITGGFNVYPKEIEDCLAAHPDVIMAAVVGAPHSIMGETGIAFVVLNPTSEVTGEDLREFCRPKLADYKVPSRVFLETSLPMTTVGKIQKTVLQETARKRLSGKK
ncbi:MAG: acyl--CoA ligase [Deltaproteobacteria bacterium]|nr:acyl--CoA ligase [Deltaproteobacteria bacterium]